MSRVPRNAAMVALVCFGLGSGPQVTRAATRPGDGSGAAQFEERANALIARMTLEQKVQQISNDTRPA